MPYAHWPPQRFQVSWGEDGSEWPLFSWKEMTPSGHSQLWRGRKRHFVGRCVLEQLETEQMRMSRAGHMAQVGFDQVGGQWDHALYAY